jgi:transposase
VKTLFRRCAGLDVHKEVVIACARIAVGKKVGYRVESFATTTPALLRLVEWLHGHGCEQVAMEATGVYWKPVWHLLEGEFALTLANPVEVRQVPGRKSDVNDATWIADLLAHGLIRGSFVPPKPIQHLRDLTRTRKQLVRQIAQATLRIQKTLEDANFKITGVVSDLLGASGRAILRGLIAGETDGERLLARTTGRLQAPRERLLEGLQGTIEDHHRFLLRLHLDQIEATEKLVERLEKHIEEALLPFHSQVERLQTIPGISEIVAATVVAEIGVDMSRFPSPGHLVSWAGLCPRLDQSAGKRRSTRTRHGAAWLKTTLVQAAWAAGRVRSGYLHAQFLRLKSRRGPKKAVVAVAASILTAIYFVLRDDGVIYQDLGSDYFDRRDKTRAAQRLVRRLQTLGFEVTLRAA